MKNGMELKQKNEFDTSSFLYSLLLAAQAINFGIIQLVPALSGYFLSISYVILFSLSVIQVAHRAFKTRIVVTPIYILMALLILVYYILSMNTSSLNATELVVYIGIPLLLSLLDVKVECVLRYIIVLTSPVFVFSSKIFVVDNVNGAIAMGTAYAFLASIIAAILHSCFFRNQRSKWMYIPYFINVFYFLQLLTYGSRGPLLCVLLTVVFVFCCKYNNELGRIECNWLKFSLITIGVIVITPIVDQILLWAQYILGKNNMSLRFLNKMIILLQNDDLSNGRMTIYSMTWTGIMERPFWGHGISSSLHYMGFEYPHNLILQLLFDGGIAFTSIVIGAFIVKMRGFIKCISRSKFIMFIFLFFLSVPSSMVSGDIWTKYALWLFLFSLWNNKFASRKESVEI